MRNIKTDITIGLMRM